MWRRTLLTVTILTMAVAAPALAQLEVDKIPQIEPRGWYWQWAALLGISAVITLTAFKNPKRTHNS